MDRADVDEVIALDLFRDGVVEPVALDDLAEGLAVLAAQGFAAALEIIDKTLECPAIEMAEGISAAEHGEGLVDGDTSVHRHADEVLHDHIGGEFEDLHRIEAALVGKAGADEAFDEVVDVRRDEDAVTDLVDRVSRASHPLEGARDALGRADHHDGVDVADVDAEFEAGGADHAAQVARLEPVLDLLADVAVERGMVAFDRLCELGQSELQPVGDALGTRAGVGEKQGGAIPLDDPGHVGDDARSGVAGGRVGMLAQRREHLDEGAASRRDLVDDGERSRSAEKGRDRLERRDGGGKTDAAKRRDGCLVRIPETAESLKTLERDTEVGAAFVFGEGMQLVDDDEVAAGEGLAEAGLREENGETLRRRDEDVGWLAALLLPLRRARVAGAEADGDDPVEPETGEGLLEILADVVGEGAQRRDVEAADALGPQAALVMLAGEAVDDAEEA